MTPRQAPARLLGSVRATMSARRYALDGAGEFGLKGRCGALRGGTTSYIIPDEILPNVEFLGPLVDDIELVLFESEDYSNMPDEATIAALARLAEEHSLTYTVHLPLDAHLAAEDAATRSDGVRKCLRTIEVTRPLGPFAYVVHVEDGDFGARGGAAAVRESLPALCDAVREPGLLCAETLSFPFEEIAVAVEELGLGVCLDVGHVLLNGYSLEEHLDRYLGRARVLHLHGILDGRDHVGLEHTAEDRLELLARRLAAEEGAERVCTLEVFSREHFESSMDVLGRYLTCRP